MALAIGGFGLGAAASTASALTVPTSTTVNQVVGHSFNVKLGNNKSYEVASCSSAAAGTVACQVLGGTALKVETWCLEPTGLGGVALTIGYNPINGAAPLPNTTVTVNCGAAPIPTIKVGKAKTKSPLGNIASVSGCSPNVAGAACTFTGAVITEACPLPVTLNVLPVLVDATVTVQGAPAINGKTTDLFFRCAQ